ncbi:hypothetical protein Syun_022809 [Stephania yunnanensis]|uniref:Uncharacterized protein n=1 Tax=Stephania yunnanensis TaxID=152371 RepID=A0AAP0HYX1_9MAGN
MTRDFATAMESIKKFLAPREKRLVSWSPPSHELVKLNTDSSFVVSINWASVGGVVCDDNNGDWFEVFLLNIGVGLTVAAELWGLLK